MSGEKNEVEEGDSMGAITEAEGDPLKLPREWAQRATPLHSSP